MDIASIEKLASKFAQNAALSVNPQEKVIMQMISRMIVSAEQVEQKMRQAPIYSPELRGALYNLQAMVQRLVNIDNPPVHSRDRR
jgi:hypothetical protein